jgi:hypothetical protein
MWPFVEVIKMHSIGEVVKQFELHVPPLEHAIKGKIVKYTDENGIAAYDWSHQSSLQANSRS